MKRKFYELNLYSYIFYRHLENTIILTWKILILASFSVILDSDLGFQNRFSGKCTRFFWVANPSKKNTVKIGVKNYVEPCIFQPILNWDSRIDSRASVRDSFELRTPRVTQRHWASTHRWRAHKTQREGRTRNQLLGHSFVCFYFFLSPNKTEKKKQMRKTRKKRRKRRGFFGVFLNLI